MIALYINYVSVNYINIELQISLDNFCSSFNAEIDPTVSIEEQDIVHIYIGETQKFLRKKSHATSVPNKKTLCTL